MKRKANTASGVYQYLELSGVLDTGSSEDIAEKRKEYWRERKRIWKQEKRKKETEFKIYLTDAELQVIAKGAKQSNISRTNYIKRAAIAYANKQYLVPDQVAVNQISQLLSLNYSFLQELAESIPAHIADTLLKQITRLEQKVLTALCNPKEISSKTTEL